jgi:hypothetical protein
MRSKWFFAYWFQGNGSGGNGTHIGYGGGGGRGLAPDIVGYGDGREPGVHVKTGQGSGGGPGGLARSYGRPARALPLGAL